MAQNYVLLERIELNASAASVTFSNIPQSGYTDLKIVMSLRSDNSSVGTEQLLYQFNSATSGYSAKSLYTYSSGTPSSTNTTTLTKSSVVWGRIGDGEVPLNSTTANTFSNTEMYIPNYTSSNYKSFSTESVAENNSSSYTELELQAGLWSNTAAITSISFALYNGNIAQYSTFSLYGLAAVGTTPAIAPKALGGNITTDGTYWIHTFLTTQTFTPLTNLTCDYLVVAGGGGGVYGGAGGAGGLRSTVTATGGGGSLETSKSFGSNTAFTVTVGAGGAGAPGGPGYQTQAAGSDSSISGTGLTTITSVGGGKGMYYTSGNSNGGSGGGTVDSSRGGSPGTGTANQGYAGGQGASDLATYTCGGGGGGAGGVGGAGSSSQAGAGGNGVATSISGSSITYAGGGGGGADGKPANAGGSGGGGAGNNGGVGTNGTVNTGGGAGGGSSSGGTGGSGIVIIRYTIA